MKLLRTARERYVVTYMAEGEMRPAVKRTIDPSMISADIVSKDGKHTYSVMFTVEELEELLMAAKGAAP